MGGVAGQLASWGLPVRVPARELSLPATRYVVSLLCSGRDSARGDVICVNAKCGAQRRYSVTASSPYRCLWGLPGLIIAAPTVPGAAAA